MAHVSGLRGVLAILAASFAAPLPIALLSTVMDRGTNPIFVLVMAFGVPIALFHVTVLGVPGFVLLAEHYRPNWLRVALAGFLIGALPWGSTDLFLNPYDWVSTAGTVVAMGVCGIAGALVFWAIVRHEPK